jgi:predicted aldo/keto reductase-like oxidoreductase
VPPERVFGPGGWASSVGKVANCQDCGECEARCPYHLTIRSRLAEVVMIAREGERAYRASQQA